MGLTQKILVFTGLLVVALVGATVIFTTVQADRLAQTEIDRALGETKGVWETFQSDRYKKLTLGVRALGNDPGFKAFTKQAQEATAEDLEATRATVQDILKERKADLDANFFVLTGVDGIVIARDRPGGAGEDLSKDPLVRRPIDDAQSSTAVWRQGDHLYHAVSVAMQTNTDTIGVLIAGYAIDEALANNIQKLTHSKIAFVIRAPGQPPQLSVSSLGEKESGLREALSNPAIANADNGGFEIEFAGDHYKGFQAPLLSSSGQTVGSVLAMRSRAEEMSSFMKFRGSLILVSLAVMLVGLLAAYLIASRITGPVRQLVGLVERARDGSFSGAVSIATSDEIGTLARAFGSLLADLNEKEQMIGFLRDGMTEMRKAAPGLSDASRANTMDSGATTATLGAGTGVTASIKLEPGTVFANRYRVVETLGKGGMGVVYRAHDGKLDEDVALKLLRPDVVKDDPTLLDRFKQEIKLARRITHRNVLRTHDFDEAAGVPYISMEYLDGVTLKDLIRQKGALPTPVGLRIAKQICHGLEAAHAQGVVHRDIKPHNMLIMPETGDLKIMDFGIARLSEVKGAGKGMTSTGVVMGTPDYMAPEQAQGLPADFRSDIYSLGVVFFEIFTGRLPFSGESVMTVVLKHIQEAPPAPRSINPRMPVELEAVILRCLEKEPDRRYANVEEILEDLTAVSKAEAAA
jgi:HAMP domain-containing protein/predicted Ser/Thr protein kinase